MLCKQAKCPYHILRALRCDEHGSDQRRRNALQRIASQLPSVRHIGGNLNESQRMAWEEIMTSPLAATIGPPGTGKTRLISAVAAAWDAVAAQGEIMLCTAYQNVATRHIAETLVRHQVSEGCPGLPSLLLASLLHACCCCQLPSSIPSSVTLHDEFHCKPCSLARSLAEPRSLAPWKQTQY